MRRTGVRYFFSEVFMKLQKLSLLSLCGLFLLPGFALASWITRTPALRDTLSASTEEMGFILFGFSSGAMLGVLSSSKLISIFHARTVILTGLLMLSAGLMVIGVSSTQQHMLSVFAGMVIFGVGLGWTEIAINVEGATTEKAIGRGLMTTLHGCFSLGTFVGAVTGMIFTAYQIPIERHLYLVSAFNMLLALVLIIQAPQNSRYSGTVKTGKSGLSAAFTELKDPKLLIIGFIVLAMALAEGAANDWLPLLMIDGHGFDETSGTLIYAGFTLAMTIGRLSGGPVIRKLGKSMVVRLSALFAAAGLLMVIYSPFPEAAVAAVILWGLGASLGFPIAISAAAEGKGNSQIRVSIAATLGYVAFLVGPPMLGFIGEHNGLRLAMLPVMILVVIAFIIAPLIINKEKKHIALKFIK